MDKYEANRWAHAQERAAYIFPGLLNDERPAGETTISVLRATPVGVTIAVQRRNPFDGEMLIHVYAGHVIVTGVYGTRYFDFSGRHGASTGIRHALGWLRKHHLWLMEEPHTRTARLTEAASAAAYEYNLQIGLERVGDAFHEELASRVQDQNWTAAMAQASNGRWWEFRSHMESTFPAADDWGRVYECLYGEGMEDLLIHDEPANRVLNISYAADTLAMLHTFRHLFASGELDHLM